MSEYPHKVLVVDGEARAGKAIIPILEAEKLQFVYTEDSRDGLEKINSSARPFSLIICDQNTSGMAGIKFLEQTRKHTPEAIRMLMAGSLDIQSIINAVNEGCVQRYLSPPLENETMLQEIRQGIEQYELFLNNEKLFLLAKKQNIKLYELNCELMEKTKHQNHEMTALDNELETIEAELKTMNSTKIMTPAQIMDALQTLVKSQGKTGQDKLNELFSHTIKVLFADFNDLALRNGFEMPESFGGSNV